MSNQPPSDPNGDRLRSLIASKQADVDKAKSNNDLELWRLEMHQLHELKRRFSDHVLSELIKRGWVEDRNLSGSYISPHTRITYKIEQACRIENLKY